MNRPVVYKFIYVDHAFMSCGLFYPLTIVSDFIFLNGIYCLYILGKTSYIDQPPFHSVF